MTEQNNRLSKILLIDDDIFQHKLVNAALSKSFSLSFEESGSRGIEKALECDPDLILLDLQMPGLDGFEVLEQFKKHSHLSHIPIFCLSASSDQESQDRCYKLGASAFLLKPINVKNFLHEINEALKKLNDPLKA